MSEPKKRAWETREIKYISGHDLGVGNVDFSYVVDKPVAYGWVTITKIAYREEYYGDHSLGWFDVFAGDTCVLSQSERFVSEVGYIGDHKA